MPDKSKKIQVFDCQDMPQKLCSKVIRDYMENDGRGNDTYRKPCVAELEEYEPELYRWLVDNGYEESKNPPHGDCLILINW
jgi:hypothetical protein